ncbi:MAG: TonB-dependent receptor [Marinilabiliaceae bacterium]|nr:TonB-dependent receptor [Marinilabiliaceae bacterium]
MSRLSIIYLFLIFFGIKNTTAQKKLVVHGYIYSEKQLPIEFVNIAIRNSSEGTISDENGHFSIPTNKSLPLTIQISCVGYQNKEIELTRINEITQPLRIVLNERDEQISDINIVGKSNHDQSLTRIDPNLIAIIPDASGGGIEGAIKTQIGVSSNNELSSTYRVRGGNFDENMVYVNNIEIYRPFLVRSGQQEGLSFTNPNLVGSIEFSPGGYNASYGDKMSSVLNIKYKRPTQFAGSINASLLGGSAHIEGITKNKKTTAIAGIRYKTNKYLVGTMDTKGDYNPNFIDFQTYLTHQLNNNLSTELMAYFSQNEYNFKPTDRETTFGTFTEVKQLKIYFEGNEKDLFQTGFIAGALSYSNNTNNSYKLIISGFRTFEEEAYDILSQYWIHDLDPVSGGTINPTDPKSNIAVGSFLQHARNDLLGQVYNASIQGVHQFERHTFSWQQKMQIEKFDDYINEWEYRDSADFNIPYNGQIIDLAYVLNTTIASQSTRLSGYIMDLYTINNDYGTFIINGGLRYNYWDYNSELLISPRLSIVYNPKWEKDVHFRLASGFYYQSPFYKELRTTKGILNKNIKAQQSIHFVAGMDIYFKTWNRPFKFTSEAYYKTLSKLISYQIDNVRIRYSGINDAKGYATGIDLKINGEFVDGVESWASLGIMKTEEDITNDFYLSKDENGNTTTHYPGYIPRPADQRLNFALFFQDYLPNNPTFKVNLNLLFSTGLPIGPPNSERYQAIFRTPPYRRVDIGFVKDLTKTVINTGNLFNELSIGVDIFNLFNISNTISYYWVTDVNNRQYAVPNYLTLRRLNFNIKAKF